MEVKMPGAKPELNEKDTNQNLEYESASLEDLVPDFSDVDEKKLLRKIDFRVLPLFTIIYLISFLDRGNIGAAKIEGLPQDLNLQSQQYNNCLTVFFIFYSCAEIPSNIILKHVKPSLFMVSAMILWGIVMTLTGLVKNYGGLIVCRSLLGILEAPLFPVFPDFPQTAKFLNDRERDLIDKNAVENLNRKAPVGEDHSNKPKYIWAVFKDWQCWASVFMYFALAIPIYGLSLFAPTIINNLGYTATKAQLLTAPVYIAAAIISIVQAYYSGVVGVRAPFIIVNFLFELVGFIICISMSPATHPKSIYAALFIIALGAYPALPVVIVWLSNNVSGSYKRAVAIAFQIGFGNFGGIVSSNIYRAQDAPRFLLGHGIQILFVSLGIIAATASLIGYSVSNSKNSKKIQTGAYDNYSDEELLEMGDKSPYFVYRL
ncbi:hypothetical protein QCA50_017088 [Cerrena zonata]|uniref:Uncharacterized protein n=1 Tax=Cerrena zonata TaxID=2478898 RepID=A0AAW0FE59_9APHY